MGSVNESSFKQPLSFRVHSPKNNDHKIPISFSHVFCTLKFHIGFVISIHEQWIKLIIITGKWALPDKLCIVVASKLTDLPQFFLYFCSAFPDMRLEQMKSNGKIKLQFEFRVHYYLLIM